MKYPVLAFALMLWSTALAQGPASLSFEDLARASDRVVTVIVEGPVGTTETLGNGRTVTLGFKDPEGRVFTRYRMTIVQCVFDADASCAPGETEILIPGGTVWENVNGELRRRTWEVTGAAGVPLPSGTPLVLFTKKMSRGEFRPVNDVGARLHIDHTRGTPHVRLRFSSPRFMSEAGRQALGERMASTNPATTRPVFTEVVAVRDLGLLIREARASTRDDARKEER